MDYKGIAQSLLENGEMPSRDLTKDDQVMVCNSAVLILRDEKAEDDDTQEADDHFVVWLGGLDRDIMVYGLQLATKKYELELLLSDKSQVRVDAVADQLAQARPMLTNSYKTIWHFPWPTVFLDGSTFEDRLERLADEIDEVEIQDQVTADMILSGVSKPYDLEADQLFKLINDCSEVLSELSQRDQYSIVYAEKLERYLQWIIDLPTEFSILGFRVPMLTYKLKLPDRKRTPTLSLYTKKHSELVRLT